ncbi:MAG: tetratricopeptide repeat protein, partial [Candidatus Micrarchaeia archaeon]
FNNLEEAIGVIEDLLKENPNYYRAMLLLAEIYIIKKNYEAAINIVQKSFQLAPDSSWAYRVYANILFEQSKNMEAIESFKKALEYSDSLNDEIIARYELSFALYSIGKLSEALNVLEKVKKIDIIDIEPVPLSLSILNFLMEIYLLLKDYKSTEDLALRIIKSKNKIYYKYKAFACLCIIQKKFDKAIKYYTKVVEKCLNAKDKTQALLFLSLLYFLKNEKKQALEYVEKAINELPFVEFYKLIKKRMLLDNLNKYLTLV